MGLNPEGQTGRVTSTPRAVGLQDGAGVHRLPTGLVIWLLMAPAPSGVNERHFGCQRPDAEMLCLLVKDSGTQGGGTRGPQGPPMVPSLPPAEFYPVFVTQTMVTGETMTVRAEWSRWEGWRCRVPPTPTHARPQRGPSPPPRRSSVVAPTRRRTSRATERRMSGGTTWTTAGNAGLGGHPLPSPPTRHPFLRDPQPLSPPPPSMEPDPAEHPSWRQRRSPPSGLGGANTPPGLQ